MNDVSKGLRCVICGRQVAVYLDEVAGRYIAHVIPLAFHRASLRLELKEK